MCGCSGSSGTRSTVRSKVCSGKVSELQTVRNKLITLEKLVSEEKRLELKDVRTNLEQVLKGAATTCPDSEIVSGLKNYIANEYTVYNS